MFSGHYSALIVMYQYIFMRNSVCSLIVHSTSHNTSSLCEVIHSWMGDSSRGTVALAFTSPLLILACSLLFVRTLSVFHLSRKLFMLYLPLPFRILFTHMLGAVM